jgi:nicotinate-nucleotide adenylyltransferase
LRKSAPFRFGSIRVRPPHAEPGQRIGLLGGSFNPPHAAHLRISQIALRRLGLDRVWWIVTPGNPLKRRGQLLPLERRLQLSRAIAADARITVTGFEQSLATNFTAGTLAFVTRRFPRTRFVWVMGADCLPEFDQWGQWREIFRMLPIAVIDRPGWRLRALSSRAAAAFANARVPEGRALVLPAKPPPAWTFLTGPLMGLSSTEIRKANSGTVAATQRTMGPPEHRAAPVSRRKA